MSKDIKLNKLVREKEESRKIVNEILNFGIREGQKYDIIFNLALTLESNDAMKDITNLLKKYLSTVNNDEEENNNNNDKKSKIILN